MSSLDPPTPPLVTVVTPTYNVAKYVGETVDSVLRQTFTNFEYLVIDDGSEDNTAEVVLTHAGDDPRFRLVPEAHKGLSATRNTGIREARGKYIAYLDGDDRWDPRFLELQVALLESLPSEVAAVFCRSRMMLENGTLAFFQWNRPGRYDFDDFLVDNNPARNGSSLLIKKSRLEEVGGFDGKLHYVEDLECWLRILDDDKTVMWGNKRYLVHQRLRPGQATKDRFRGDQAILQLLADQTPKLRRSAVGLAYVRPAFAALKYGADDEMAENLAKTARAAGIGQLARTAAGRRFLFWDTLPPSGRRLLRDAQRSTREAIKSANRRIRGA
jgi:glycosyltransferase involved in cell wall biosynthesis